MSLQQPSHQPAVDIDIDDDAITERFVRDEVTEVWSRATGVVDVVRESGVIRVVTQEAAR